MRRTGELHTVDSPVHLDGIAKRPATSAPRPSERGREILTGLCYAPERIEALLCNEVARGA